MVPSFPFQRIVMCSFFSLLVRKWTCSNISVIFSFWRLCFKRIIPLPFLAFRNSSLQLTTITSSFSVILNILAAKSFELHLRKNSQNNNVSIKCFHSVVTNLSSGDACKKTKSNKRQQFNCQRSDHISCLNNILDVPCSNRTTARIQHGVSQSGQRGIVENL